MKKLLFLLLFALPLIAFTSCGTDDDPISDDKEQGLGDNGEGDHGSDVETADIIEPILEFGKDKEYIKEKETRTLSDENESLLFYTDDSNVREITYSFNPELFTINMKIAQLNYQQVVKYYTEKYQLDSSDDEMKITSFRNKNNTIAVAVYDQSELLNCVMVTYLSLAQ